MFVRKSLRQAGFTLLAATLLLTACNLGATPAPTVDVNTINTAAVATAMGQLSAQFTQTALAAPSALPTFGLATTTGAAPTTPGHSQSFIVKLTAPAAAGEYFGYWRMQGDDGKFFGPRVYLDIIVK